MLTCIVRQKDKEDFLFESETVPLNGFERQENGSYIKRIGDPRCITDTEEEKRVREERAQKENKKLVLMGSQQNSCPLILIAKKKVSLGAFVGSFVYAMKSYVNSEDTSRIKFTGVTIMSNLGFEVEPIKHMAQITKMLIDTKTLEIDIWTTNKPLDGPNWTIKDALSDNVI
jgi:hypothetical protein